MSTIPWLEPSDNRFPSTEAALDDPNGLLAVGGDLSCERLIKAYRQGIFPWYQQPEPILWWSPSPRAVLFPEQIHISRSLKKTLNRGLFTVTADQQFQQVVTHCSNTPRPGQDGTWIGSDILNAYQQLHEMGVAHSLEVWRDNELVGGLYGLAIGKIFFGESMFSLCTDASKVAFVYLAKQLQQWGFGLIDCQVSNPHLTSLGAIEIERARFNEILLANIDQTHDNRWAGDWKLPANSLQSRQPPPQR